MGLTDGVAVLQAQRVAGSGAARGRRIGAGHAALVLPLVLFLLLLFAYPVASMLWRSVGPGIWPELLAGSVFWRVMQITLEIGLIVTVCCLLLAYPLAYVLARLPAPTANLLMIFVLIPFWTSILVRSYAWMALLERHGIVNNLLLFLHLIDAPVKLLNTRFSVCLAMVHVLLPFMVLPIYATLRALDWRLVRAAESLGATPLGTLVAGGAAAVAAGGGRGRHAWCSRCRSGSTSRRCWWARLRT